MVNALDGDVLYSRSDASDLDMVKIEAKLLLYDHDSHSNSSCSKEDDLEALGSYPDTINTELNLETHEMLNRNLRTKNKLTRIGLWWVVVPGYKTLGFHRVRYQRIVSHNDLWHHRSL